MTTGTNESKSPTELQGGCPRTETDLTEPREARLFNAPRCQARTKAGPACRSPAVGGKRVCRYHGGAKGSGGQLGQRNGAYRHGAWTNEAVAVRREASALLKRIREAATA